MSKKTPKFPEQLFVMMEANDGEPYPLVFQSLQEVVDYEANMDGREVAIFKLKSRYNLLVNPTLVPKE